MDAGRLDPHLLGDLRIVRRNMVRKHQDQARKATLA